MGKAPARDPTRRWAEQAHRDAVAAQAGVERVVLGPFASYSLVHDPRHLCFVLARYKFCSKMLQGKRNVLEVGCGDATGLPIVAQAVGRVQATDWDADLVEDDRQRLPFLRNCAFSRFDPIQAPFAGPPAPFDAAYLVDVIEHVEPSQEAAFMANLLASLEDDAVCLVGTPNVQASRYASPQSEVGHINLKSHQALRELMAARFKHVFLFSMNDEVVHTGYYPMAHYLWAMGASKK